MFIESGYAEDDQKYIAREVSTLKYAPSHLHLIFLFFFLFLIQKLKLWIN